MPDIFIYIILGIISIASALGLLLSRNAVYAALFLVLNFGVAAVFYLLMNAPFLAVVQVSVYAGAIMVLFLFVIMLLGAERLPVSEQEGMAWQRPVAILLAALLVVQAAYALFTRGNNNALAATYDSSPLAIGQSLFSTFSFPFEVVSILLLVAMVGAVVLTRDK
jgi:NADH-quinone oxidoreductase subunit J